MRNSEGKPGGWNHADGQQRGQSESPRMPCQGTAIKLTLSFCIYHLWCKYIQMSYKAFMKSGRLYRRLFSQESRISQFMQLNLAYKTPRSYDALCQGSQDIMPDDLMWSWCNNNNRNKGHNKCNVFESFQTHHHQLPPHWWKNCLPWNRSLVPKSLGTAFLCTVTY